MIFFVTIVCFILAIKIDYYLYKKTHEKTIAQTLYSSNYKIAPTPALYKTRPVESLLKI